MATRRQRPKASLWHSPYTRPGRPKKRAALDSDSRAEALRELVAGARPYEHVRAPGYPSCYCTPDGFDAAELRVLYRFVRLAIDSVSPIHKPTVPMMEAYLHRVCEAFRSGAAVPNRRRDCINGVPGFQRKRHTTVPLGTLRSGGKTYEVRARLELEIATLSFRHSIVAYHKSRSCPLPMTKVDDFKPHQDVNRDTLAACTSLARDTAAAFLQSAERSAVAYGTSMIRARLRGGDITKMGPWFERFWRPSDGHARPTSGWSQLFHGGVVSLFGEAAALKEGCHA